MPRFIVVAKNVDSDSNVGTVVGSFNKRAQAEKYIEKRKEKNAEPLKGGGKRPLIRFHLLVGNEKVHSRLNLDDVHGGIKGSYDD